jgi:hypothetical protein
MRLAPKVFVSSTSAPACAYSACTARDQVRARGVQFIVTLVDVDALRVQHRSHRAVEDDDAFGIEQSFEQGRDAWSSSRGIGIGIGNDAITAPVARALRPLAAGSALGRPSPANRVVLRLGMVHDHRGGALLGHELERAGERHA